MQTDSISFDLVHSEPLLIVISGPSGVGKDSVIRALQRRGSPLHVVVTTTDRPPRPGEVDGVDYNFVSHERFLDMIANDEFIENALVYGDLKGIQQVQISGAIESGLDVIMRVDVQGAARMRHLFPEAVLIFLTPTDQDEWLERLMNRHSETPESLNRRIKTAQKELESLPEFDYIVVNAQNCLERTVDHILAIIQAEHLRVHHRKIRL